jgi:hypothetical protein
MPSGLVKGRLTIGQLLGDSNPYSLNMSAGTTGTALAVGDFVFLLLDSTGTTANANTPAPPTGFRELVTWQALATSGTTTYGIYVKKRTVGETNYSIPQLNVGRTNKVNCHAFWVDGANADIVDNFVLGTIGTRAGSGGTFDTIAPSVTTSANNAMVFAIGAERTTAAETEAQLTVSGTGWAKQAAILGAAAASTTFTVASKGMASSGASGAVTFTNVNTQATNGAALQIIIPALPDAPPSSFPGQIWDGTNLVNGQWFVAGAGDTIDPLLWAGMIWPGYESIDAMLAEDFFYSGHRGGSGNWPEMSMQAYTQAALRGYGGLEVSLARTSDGVFIGNHDGSLDRTSLGTVGSTLLVSAMTWAAVQTHDQLPVVGAPVTTDHQPYARLEEILDAYIDSHVLWIDIKTASAFRNDLVTLLKTYPNWHEKIVAKSVPGSGNSSWLATARAAGFVTNAMFYEGENFTTYHAQADILGMEYSASGGTWTSILSHGKPVVAHVVPSTTALATAVGLGAAGATVSRPNQVPLITF